MKKILSVILAVVMVIMTAANLSAETAAPALTVSNTDSTANRLSWTKVDGAESYVVYLLNEDTGRYKKCGEVKGTSCRHKNLAPNTKYTYRVRAKFPDGTFGKFSKAASVYTRNKYGNNPANLYDESIVNVTFPAVQGETMYFFSYHDLFRNDGKLYSIGTDGSGLTILASGISDGGFLNVIGENLYYYRGDRKAVCSMSTGGGEEQVLLSLSERFDSDEYYTVYLEYLYAVDATLYFRLHFQQNFETEPFYEWYALDLNGGDALRLTSDRVERYVVRADENSVTFGYNYYRKGWKYEYGAFETYYTDENSGERKNIYGGSCDEPVEMSLSKSFAADCSPYRDQNGIWYTCDVSGGRIFPIEGADRVWQSVGTVYRSDGDSIFALRNGESYLLRDGGYTVCYADDSVVILKKCEIFSSYKERTEYWTICPDGSNMKLIWDNNGGTGI